MTCQLYFLLLNARTYQSLWKYFSFFKAFSKTDRYPIAKHVNVSFKFSRLEYKPSPPLSTMRKFLFVVISHVLLIAYFVQFLLLRKPILIANFALTKTYT